MPANGAEFRGKEVILHISRRTKPHKNFKNMKSFLYPEDLGNLQEALKEASEVKKNHYAFENLGKHRTALLIFFNNSLRTRLSRKILSGSFITLESLFVLL